MVSKKSDDKANPGFTIENNIIKGVRKEMNIKSYEAGQIILKILRSNPTHVAQIDADTDKQTTYKQMTEDSIRCALWMQKQGIGSGDVIAVCTHNQEDAYIPCLAAFYVGAAFNPWHHEIALKTARHLMSLTRPKVMFSCESSITVLKEAARLEKVDARIIVIGKYPDVESLKDTMRLQTNEEVRVYEPGSINDPRSIAMILFSSGTTGLPKGVAHSYATLVKIFETFALIPRKQVCLWYSSLYWISGTFCMLQSILAGATRIIEANFDVEGTCRTIEKYKINWLFLAPSAITLWSKSKALNNYKLESVQKVLTGGSKLSREVFDEFKKSLPRAEVSQAFGMTELGGLATFQTNKCKSDSAGFVVPNAELKIIDIDTGEALGPNQPGELCAKTSTLMLYYYKNPTATKEAIDNQGWLHTGDKAYYEPDGQVFIVDRLKEVMKFRGHHVSPYEIEEILVAHPGVMEVAVVPVPHEVDGERPMAFVKKVPGAKVTEQELIELSSELGEYKKLRGGVKFLDKIPYTASGKISRKDLKEMAKGHVIT